MSRLLENPQAGKGIGGLIALVIVFAFVGIISSCLITIGIWPGQLKLLAPVFCTDTQPDAFVVSDTYSPRPGETVTDFSLHCMGERGDATDHGFLRPFLLISVVNGVAVVALFFLIVGLLRLSRGRRPTADDDGDEREDDAPPTGVRSQAPSGSTAGPFVD